MRIHWAGPPATMENGRRLPQPRRARRFESFTIVLAALLRPSWGTAFKAGDRLAHCLLPNEHDYLELVYACAWLGVTTLFR